MEGTKSNMCCCCFWHGAERGLCCPTAVLSSRVPLMGASPSSLPASSPSLHFMKQLSYFTSCLLSTTTLRLSTNLTCRYENRPAAALHASIWQQNGPSVDQDVGAVCLKACVLGNGRRFDEWLLAGDCWHRFEAILSGTGEVSNVGCNYDKWPRSQLRCCCESRRMDPVERTRTKNGSSSYIPNAHCKTTTFKTKKYITDPAFLEGVQMSPLNRL